MCALAVEVLPAGERRIIAGRGCVGCVFVVAVGSTCGWQRIIEVVVGRRQQGHRQVEQAAGAGAVRHRFDAVGCAAVEGDI